MYGTRATQYTVLSAKDKMWTTVSVLLTCLSLVASRPAQDAVNGNFSTKPLSPEDYEWLERHTGSQRVTVYPAGFQYMYVSQSGRIVEHTKPSSGHWIQVVGSPLTSHQGLYTAALEVGKMVRHSPSHIFNNIANHAGAGLGVFTRTEKLTIFPEFHSLADTPACHGRCDGSCKHTCTFDGRKYETLSGVTSSKSVVLIDNVMCTSHDPHHKIDNILVHEFGHAVNRFGFSSHEKTQLTAAYNHAKSQHLWTASSYAMANEAEYFGEATGAYFTVNLQSSTGGMNICGNHKCATETEARARLRTHDVLLFNLLNHVYTNGHSSTASGLHICP